MKKKAITLVVLLAMLVGCSRNESSSAPSVSSEGEVSTSEVNSETTSEESSVASSEELPSSEELSSEEPSSEEPPSSSENPTNYPDTPAGIEVPQSVFEYYASVDFNKTGNNLKLELYNKIKGHVSTSYNGLNATMAITDRNWDLSPDPNDSNPYMVLIYASYNDTNPKKYSTRSNDVWDKEHIWAKSHGNFGDTPPAGSDMHHLRASDKSNNGSRGNLDFGKANSVKSTINDYDGKPSGKTGTQTGKSGTVYEPLPQYRGDVARAMFYMATRYHNDTQTQLTLVDNTTSSSTGAGKFGILSTLLEWHLQDPVDEFEFRRNGLVQGYQNNRNPYIDFPSLAHDVFG